jgi:hypothetical protein
MTLRRAAVVLVVAAVAFAGAFAAGRATRSQHHAVPPPRVERFVPPPRSPVTPNLDAAGAFPGLSAVHGVTR